MSVIIVGGGMAGATLALAISRLKRKPHRQRGEKAGRNRSVDGSCEKAMSVIIVGGGMAGATLALAISRLSPAW